MIEQIHQYANPLDEHEPDPGELEYVDINDPQLTEQLLSENPEGDAYAPPMLRATVSDNGEVGIRLDNFEPSSLL
jgi:hypothetical protein